MKHVRSRSTLVPCLIAAACLAAAAQSPGDYPMTLTTTAKATSGAASVTSAVTIHVDRLMEENRWKRVTDALTYNGYAKFVPVLRELPPIGSIEVQGRSVEIRYAREQKDASGRRLVVVADRPLFFLGDPTKNRAGYELTIAELRFAPDGAVSGTMAGAARVKPSAEGPVLDDFAEVRVQLNGRVTHP
jgi:hypothetical protein